MSGPLERRNILQVGCLLVEQTLPLESQVLVILHDLASLVDEFHGCFSDEQQAFVEEGGLLAQALPLFLVTWFG